METGGLVTLLLREVFSPGGSPSPVPAAVLLGVLGLLPFALLAVTSYLKLSVVFGILRSALGLQQVPSPGLTGLLSLVLTGFIMAPVFDGVYRTMEAHLGEKKAEPADQKKPDKNDPVTRLIDALGESTGPLEQFLKQHSHEEESRYFCELRARVSKAESSAPCDSGSFAVLVPAFVISELNEAFVIGFTLFLPFLVVDLVVANVLMAMGMSMVSPQTISLPLKLLLFASVDGWLLLSQSLITGYLGQ